MVFWCLFFAQRVDLNVSRKERGFKDDQPDVITHGVTGRLSYYGLGVKTATFQLGVKGKRGFVTRSKSKGKQQVSECAFTDELIATAESRGYKWLEAAEFHEGSGQEDAKTSYLPRSIRDHVCIKDLQDNEQGLHTFTTMIAMNVKPDYIEVSTRVVLVRPSEHIVLVRPGNRIVLVRPGNHIVLVRPGKRIVLVYNRIVSISLRCPVPNEIEINLSVVDLLDF
jgi:hypothetical protein